MFGIDTALLDSIGILPAGAMGLLAVFSLMQFGYFATAFACGYWVAKSPQSCLSRLSRPHAQR